MKLRHLRVERFRGIRLLDWIPSGETICLVGPGDSTKTTILDAIEWGLFPGRSLQVRDTDFHDVDPTEPILIEATVGELPSSLLSEQKFGLEQRGWTPDGLRDEPENGDETVLTVRLTVDDSLEPRWEVVNDRQTTPRPIWMRDREALGVSRLGPDVERHLAWGRGSALLRLTSSTEEMNRTLAAAHRKARDTVNAADIADLKDAAERASEAARATGAGATETYRPALDPGAGGVGAAALGLHHGSVPVRAAGLGSRRLAALGVQRVSVPEGAVVLIDEIEGGLEPHRVRHLLRELRATDEGQVVMTTHSEVSIVELSAGDLRVVNCDGGMTTVRRVPDELQAAVRSVPEALLGRRLIVCEGKTEVGLCRALDIRWAEAHGAPPANVGIVVVPGGGATAPGMALGFSALGYRTALLADSDVPLDPPEEELRAGGVSVFTWVGAVSTEERVALDVPWEVLLAVVDKAAELWDEDAPGAAREAVANRLGAPPGSNPAAWLEQRFNEEDIRRAVGQTAKAKGWFKRVDLGQALGQIVVATLLDISDSDLATKLNTLSEWAYA